MTITLDRSPPDAPDEADSPCECPIFCHSDVDGADPEPGRACSRLATGDDQLCDVCRPAMKIRDELLRCHVHCLRRRPDQ